MKPLKLLFLVLIILGVSCSKEVKDEPRVIEPGSYFPVYPGSWWIYNINDSIIVKDSTYPNYILTEIPSQAIDKEQVYVPFLNTSLDEPIEINGSNAINGFVFKYDRVVFYPKKGPGNTLWPILSERIGQRFDVIPYDVTHNPTIEKSTVQAKVFNGQDSVLIINSYFTNIGTHEVLPFKRHREFTKNIGLSMNVLYDTLKGDTVYKKILLDYYVNR